MKVVSWNINDDYRDINSKVKVYNQDYILFFFVIKKYILLCSGSVEILTEYKEYDHFPIKLKKM